MNRELRDYLELTKPRICVMALIMATLGFFLAEPTEVSGPLLGMWMGMGLVGAGCGALNQFLEREFDKVMRRTQNRPLPSGRMKAEKALYFGVVCAFVGLGVLFFAVNSLTALLGLFVLVSYLALYTPSKRRTSLSTLVGAIPGALPALMGWTSATGKFGTLGWVLFGVVFLWQIPHFLAIAWIYRDEYARAGMPVLPVLDVSGEQTGRQVLLYLVGLIAVTLVPGVVGLASFVYVIGALVLGFAFLATGLSWIRVKDRVAAKRLFRMSLVYLPALGVLWIWNRI